MDSSFFQIWEHTKPISENCFFRKGLIVPKKVFSARKTIFSQAKISYESKGYPSGKRRFRKDVQSRKKLQTKNLAC